MESESVPEKYKETAWYNAVNKRIRHKKISSNVRVWFAQFVGNKHKVEALMIKPGLLVLNANNQPQD